MAEELFQIQEVQSVSVLEFRFRPEMDALLFDTLMESITVRLDERAGRSWVVDLSQVSYLNSSGLGLLCNIRFKIRQGKGKLAICGMSPRLMELFRSCCLERLFVITNTRSEALAAVRR
jgi:anti-sigma B factor antagonist